MDPELKLTIDPFTDFEQNSIKGWYWNYRRQRYMGDFESRKNYNYRKEKNAELRKKIEETPDEELIQEYYKYIDTNLKQLYNEFNQLKAKRHIYDKVLSFELNKNE